MKSIDNRGEKSSSDSEGMDKTEYQNRKKIAKKIIKEQQKVGIYKKKS